MHLEVCASNDLLNSQFWAEQNGLPPTLDTLHLGHSYHLHPNHRFLSTWGVVLLKEKTKQKHSLALALTLTLTLTVTRLALTFSLNRLAYEYCF